MQLIHQYLQKYQGGIVEEESSCHFNTFIFNLELIAPIDL